MTDSITVIERRLENGESFFSYTLGDEELAEHLVESAEPSDRLRTGIGTVVALYCFDPSDAPEGNIFRDVESLIPADEWGRAQLHEAMGN